MNVQRKNTGLRCLYLVHFSRPFVVMDTENHLECNSLGGDSRNMADGPADRTPPGDGERDDTPPGNSFGVNGMECCEGV